jgi:serine/threonine protein kinase
MNTGMKVMIDDLTLLKCLGKGSYGEVFLTSKAGKSQLFATKKMDRKYADQPHVSKYLRNEIAILRELNHRNIVKLEDVKVTQNHYYLVMEYCNGGALSECLRNFKKKYGRPFPVEIVQYLMRQIIEGIRYIHNRNIIHRDLKLDNILVNFNSENDKNDLNMMRAVIKIIDFGFATHIGNSNLCYSTLGSPINMDPNILKKMTEKKMGLDDGRLVGYDQKADIWSIGTLCYEMLIGRSAFNSKSMQELVQKVESGSYVIPTFLSKEVVSFLNAMLQYNAQKRLSANDLARHHFLTKNVRDFEPIDVRKVSNKVNQNNLHVNIKRNQTIWSIFNQEDEKKLINIPGNYLSPMSEIKEEEEYVSGPQDNKRRNTEKIPRLNKNLYEIFPQENIDQYEINKKNTQKYQGYGVGINGLNAYNNTNNQGYGFGNFRQQAPHMAPNFPYPFPMVVPASVPASIPSIEKVEPEDGPKILRGGRQGPIMQIPSFGVPSPNEESNADKGYCFSSGIFQPNVSESEEDSEYTCVGGGYGYGYGYESNE